VTATETKKERFNRLHKAKANGERLTEEDYRFWSYYRLSLRNARRAGILNKWYYASPFSVQRGYGNGRKFH